MNYVLSNDTIGIMKISIDQRRPDFNVPDSVEDRYGADFLLDVFRCMARVRYFESGIIDAVEEGELKYPVYLSSGQEAVAAVLSKNIRHYLTFPQHRAHDIYLSWGGSPERLRDELLGLPGGTSKGRAGSNCLQLHEKGVDIFGHHGLIGENVPQAVGAALGSGKPTVCIFGDGAAEEDYVLAAIGFAASRKLPVLFICIDNDLSILTPVEVRRNWKLGEVAKGFGVKANECADDPRAVAYYIEQMTESMPALLNIHVCRGYWHVGIGVDGAPAWDRFELVKKELILLEKESEIELIENNERIEMEKVWGRKLLLKPFGK